MKNPEKAKKYKAKYQELINLLDRYHFIGTIPLEDLADKFLFHLKSQIEKIGNPALGDTPYDWRAGYNQARH